MSKQLQFRSLMRCVVLAGGGLAALGPLAAQAQTVPSQIRSTTDVRQRIPDEHDRPYNRETQSHRGWEIREPQYTVFAKTSQADARWAASHVAAAWSNAAALAGRWTQVGQNPDFGLNSLQVVIDDEPLRTRESPLTTVNVVGIQTQVQLVVGAGQPPLKDQVVRLREATAMAVLHTAGLDSAAPPWVVAGIASFAGRQGLGKEEIAKAEALSEVAHLGGQQWRFQREAQDVLAYRRLNHTAADAQVAFLLTGNDAQSAPALLAALSQANVGAARTAAEGGAFRNFSGDPQPASTNTPFDGLIAERQSQFEAWQKEPLAGQPKFEPAADTAPELVAAQAEMLVLLKLQQRLAKAAVEPTRGGGTTVNSRGGVKIATFDRAAGTSAAPAKPTALGTFSDLAARLTDPSQPVWATLDVDGSLLLSTDVARVRALLASAEQRYSLESVSGKPALVRRLDGNRVLRGWLAENPEQKTRPLAKFEVVSAVRRAANSAPPTQKQARVELSR